MVYTISCEICGTKVLSKSSKRKYCSKCSKIYKLVCENCGKIYITKKTHKNTYNSCSHECSLILSYKYTGKITFAYKMHELGMNKEQFVSYIDKLHNIDMLTVLDISKIINISRMSINRFCKENNIRTRTVSEDNKRRYSTMTVQDKKKQTEKCNKAIRKYFKNKEWKINQIKKVRLGQINKQSKAEKMLQDALDIVNIEYITQYKENKWKFDFFIEKYNLVIEVDGEYWHSIDKVKERDLRKNIYCFNKGYNILRFPSSKVEKNPKHYANIVWCTICDILGD